MRFAKKQTYTRYTRMNEKKKPVNCTNKPGRPCFTSESKMFRKECKLSVFRTCSCRSITYCVHQLKITQIRQMDYALVDWEPSYALRMRRQLTQLHVESLSTISGQIFLRISRRKTVDISKIKRKNGRRRSGEYNSFITMPFLCIYKPQCGFEGLLLYRFLGTFRCLIQQ